MISSPTVQRSRHHLILLGAVGVWMFWAAGHFTVFDDEAFSCRRYVLPAGDMVSALWHGVEPDPPLYYLLQNSWVRVFGVGPVGLRSLSIALFLVGLLFLREAAAFWHGERVARATLVIAAIHPAHLFFGFAGRWYSAMFCAVAILLWLTARIAKSATPTIWSAVGWAVAAAAVCYANYFGPVVVGLCWIAGVREKRDARIWIPGILAAALLYAPWMPPFWHQLTAFPQLGDGWQGCARTAGRTLMALSAGNLASPGAWWVWAPMAIFGVCFAALMVAGRRIVASLLLVVGGCFVAGVLSRTMIDKYVMTFSGPACVLAAALLVGESKDGAKSRLGSLRRTATIALALAWGGCAVNLTREMNWSSLRWLDPFKLVIEESAKNPRSPTSPDDWVMTHPSARYYFALHAIERRGDATLIRPDVWREHGGDPGKADADVPATPQSTIARLATKPPERLLVIRTAGFSDDANWQRLDEELTARYQLEWDKAYLPDPDAAMKDRIDPRYQHPSERIRAELWRMRGD